MTRILLLTASFGSGHNAAAATLAGAFRREGAEVAVIDHFRELVHPVFARVSGAVYSWILRRAPLAWAAAYEVGDWMPSDSPLTFGATRLGARALGRLIERLRPDAVVTVHATPAVAMSWLARTGHHLPPHTTVVTDFVAHSQWVMSHVDRYCVAAPEVRHELIARGVPAERVLVTGVPVARRFAAPLDRAGARRQLGLSLEIPVALAMAGSQGSLGRLPDVARALLELGRPVQGLMVAGRDGHLTARLESLTHGHPIRTFGYVHDVASLMAAADLLVTKAGGMTVAEALAAQVPLVAFGSLPGQERRNERFASRAGIALRARSRQELVEVLERALSGPELLTGLRQRMRRLCRPDAARRVVAAVLERTTA